MGKPIFDTDFWVKRINLAKRSEKLEYSVGIFNFKEIDPVHREIVKYEIGSKSVLDVGCGYGRSASWFNDVQYQGIDFVPEFIEIARQKHPTKRFEVVDFRKLPYYTDGEPVFDFALLVSIRQMVQGNEGDGVWKEIRKELKRVAKKLLILEYQHPGVYEIDGDTIEIKKMDLSS